MKLGPRQQKWVDALRSGNYTQGSDSLHKIDNGRHEHCCLGVACDLFKEQQDLDKDIVSDREVGISYVYYDDEDLFLPCRIMDYLHMKSSSGDMTKYEEDEPTRSLAVLNDQGYTFEQIANIIEENAEKLFKKSV